MVLPVFRPSCTPPHECITMLWLKEMGTVLVVPVGDGEYFLLSDMAGRDVVLNFTVGLREEIIRESKS